MWGQQRWLVPTTGILGLERGLAIWPEECSTLPAAPSRCSAALRVRPSTMQAPLIKTAQARPHSTECLLTITGPLTLRLGRSTLIPEAAPAHRLTLGWGQH